ncbi:MAG: GspE/PulE family protein [Thermodesulfobacteriota bacterium]
MTEDNAKRKGSAPEKIGAEKNSGPDSGLISDSEVIEFLLDEPKAGSPSVPDTEDKADLELGLEDLSLEETTSDHTAASSDSGANGFEILKEKDGESEEIPRVYSAGDDPIIMLASKILKMAIQEGAAVIHLDAFEKQFRVRFRKDGRLFTWLKLPLEIKDPLIVRYKILAGMDITEKRVSQNGSIKVALGKERRVEFWVATLPALFGESMEMKVLEKNPLILDLSELGFSQDEVVKFKKAIHRPSGLIIITGPSVSGKTSTLYSALAMLNSEQVKIITVEDRVERHFDGITQVAVVKQTGMTRARGLRAVLALDADIGLAGGLRDGEEAVLAVKCALAGRLILAGMDPDDCAGAVMRLLEMGLEPYEVSSALILCVAQRLVRRLCPHCKMPASDLDTGQLIAAGYEKDDIGGWNLYQGAGCDHCGGSGYKGRLGLFEVMEITPKLRRVIRAGVTEDELMKIARKEGLKTLRQDGLEKARMGLTSLNEVLSHTFPNPGY